MLYKKSMSLKIVIFLVPLLLVFGLIATYTLSNISQLSKSIFHTSDSIVGNDNEIEAGNIYRWTKENLRQEKYIEAEEWARRYIEKFDKDNYEFDYEVKYFLFYSLVKQEKYDDAFNFLLGYITDLQSKDQWSGFYSNYDYLNVIFYDMIIGQEVTNLRDLMNFCKDEANFIFPFIKNEEFELKTKNLVEKFVFDKTLDKFVRIDEEAYYEVLLAPSNSCREEFYRYTTSNRTLFLKYFDKNIIEFELKFQDDSNYFLDNKFMIYFEFFRAKENNNVNYYIKFHPNLRVIKDYLRYELNFVKQTYNSIKDYLRHEEYLENNNPDENKETFMQMCKKTRIDSFCQVLWQEYKEEFFVIND